jgi:hypothetical protein
MLVDGDAEVVQQRLPCLELRPDDQGTATDELS